LGSPETGLNKEVILNFKLSSDFQESTGGSDQVIENIEKIVKSKGVNGGFGFRQFRGNFSGEA
jgi:hypothetical protein